MITAAFIFSKNHPRLMIESGSGIKKLPVGSKSANGLDLFLFLFCFKSETRMTARVLKQDPNTQMFQKNAIY